MNWSRVNKADFIKAIIDVRLHVQYVPLTAAPTHTILFFTYESIKSTRRVMPVWTIVTSNPNIDTLECAESKQLRGLHARDVKNSDVAPS